MKYHLTAAGREIRGLQALQTRDKSPPWSLIRALLVFCSEVRLSFGKGIPATREFERECVLARGRKQVQPQLVPLHSMKAITMAYIIFRNYFGVGPHPGESWSSRSRSHF